MGKSGGSYTRARVPGGRLSPTSNPQTAALVPVTLFGASDLAGMPDAAPDPTDHELAVAAAILERWNNGIVPGGRSASPKTAVERLGDLRHLGRFAWQTESPAEVLARMVLQGQGGSIAIVSRWHAAMIDAGLADTTRARRIVSVRGAIGAAMKLGAVRWGLYDIEVPRFKLYGRTSGPPWRDVERVCEMLRDAGRWRELALVLLLYDVGLRSREAGGLMVHAIDWSAREARVIRKGRTDETIVRLTARTCEALRRTIESRPDQWRTRGPVFTHGFKAPRPWSHTAVRNVTMGLGLGRPHGLRHALGTRTVELTNGDMRAAQGALGHANVATTQVYVDTRLRSMQSEAMLMLDDNNGEGWIDGEANANQDQQAPRERAGDVRTRKRSSKQAAQGRGASAQATRRSSKQTGKQASGAKVRRGRIVAEHARALASKRKPAGAAASKRKRGA